MIGSEKVAVVRGGGDLATGIIYRLWRTGFRVLCLEIQKPLVVRRTVSAASAIFDGSITVDGMPVQHINTPNDIFLHEGVSIIVDPDALSLEMIKPFLLVDSIMAKRNLGTHMKMAPLVIGIGPGFVAKEDVHYVVETKRGHYLGRLIEEGTAIPDTGIPGVEMGYSIERLLRAPCDGYIDHKKDIGDHVEPGDLIGKLGREEIRATIPGMLRGLIHPSVYVKKGLKIGDIDPRNVREHCFSITDKALAISGGVLEAVCREIS
ncbi:MAG: selenium-dependent molybdenum cofactor biosynthesis protein YqeB [Synergistaceae bacterium]|nr:selenium-dependent molybdenum cofactor biosynthesis protein YqeB [Synergistaceae bacterium]MDD3672536.1 selenium-dependent molybdenum cofactor biosynthesis protein YqeB [Synergistaceae bacterium]MDY0284211.1 selenium-dependent molybdenum cofactor biosynthesis protein YqeB [Synergistaceae bacterium]